MPFIGVAPDLYDYFVRHDGRRTYAAEIDPVVDLFIAPCTYTNNLPALDYFMIALGDIDLTNAQTKYARTISSGDQRDAYRNQCWSDNRKSFVEAHKKIIADGLANNTCRIRDKYVALRAHHNLRVDALFSDEALLIS